MCQAPFQSLWLHSGIKQTNISTRHELTLQWTQLEADKFRGKVKQELGVVCNYKIGREVRAGLAANLTLVLSS